MSYALKQQSTYNILDIDTSTSFDFFNGFMDVPFRNHIVEMILTDDMGIEMSFSDDDKKLYACNPKALSKKLYGTPDLALILCMINNITNFGDFDCKNNIKILTIDEINMFIDMYNTFN